jgi:hypothetical protein
MRIEEAEGGHEKARVREGWTRAFLGEVPEAIEGETASHARRRGALSATPFVKR